MPEPEDADGGFVMRFEYADSFVDSVFISTVQVLFPQKYWCNSR
jgi:hypothetical protein